MKEDNQFFRFWRKFNLSGAATTTLTPQTPVPPVPPNKPDQALGKILVVDDDLIIQRTVMHALEEKRYQVFTAADISEALAMVRREKPDLILLDLTFPFNPSDMGGPLRDGFFVIEWLRRAIGGKAIPIIIISGTDPAPHQAQISASGIVAYFRKPLDHDQLLAAVHSALGKGRWS